ncbi:alanine racemase [Oceanobacillus massiliensis]|uniref:alanine racemase n=1 Tax=Oceanobacillus massiliensis TaxID=1465765 RepID=UPI000287E918|nr:alanine racemase [Oceanobacillus massiliensis]
MKHGSYRDTWVEVSLDAIEANVKTFKEHIQQTSRLMAVVKADGYGHGAVQAARTSIDAGADYLAVAFLDEALHLRGAGITEPILILGYTPPSAVQKAIENDITLTVFSEDVIEEINQAVQALNKKAKIHLKIDSGMNRIGIQNKEEALKMSRLLGSPNILLEGIFTHFADSDNLDPIYTYNQFKKFISITDHLEEHHIHIPIKHCCNSAATISYPEMHLDMVRVGVSLYGLYPEDHLQSKIRLQQAMSFKTKPVMVKTVAAGEPISYGCTYTPEKESVIATIPVGYADGFSRQLSNKGCVTVKGNRAPIVGRVCMDQSMIDVSGIESVAKSDVVTLFGDPANGYVSLKEVADLMATIHYEAACLIGERVPRVYIRNA